MDNIRYRKGISNLDKIDGEIGKKVIDSLKNISPETGQFIIEFAFGDIYERKILDLKQREMITLSSLITQGDTHNQLIVHINGALNVGLTRNEIIETFVQCIPYVGFPKVLNAISTAKEVFNSRK
ncbi:4-carboxymuconolactone decarboxylase [Liquorilactobacillus sucicola DSM 21376 = JCM 15457]|uniref:Carboxymuconolactone decarboxylase family protein n=1 Tax=Liquorilactobacillus sucicola DSM 21376 = JCM 15457 TaxID=1423806 RepID=A0A023CUR5_9LACO|nr:carboxymuconolactone decarboxylase family protein [Liquorilactobacillus sucicola]KRN05530.1 carboxymuconolactone decarboxylase family protein [Liquorilactobacillus sucicola DSM 21376 = JCM 15457]GAJ25612.1 4-carboxymuconolactone decarboxylase [Liquorilactobacillus sucicola DSM 21376 = JCM 15457]